MDKRQNKIFFIVTIDVEGDNLWVKPKKITTTNSRYLPRFQNLCEKYCLKPTYLVNYEMVEDNYFRKFIKQKITHNMVEVGMHLHSWNSPPIKPLTEDDYFYHPYLYEYEDNIVDRKIQFMTTRLEDLIDKKVISHRSGRWAINSTYVKILYKYGYRIDCSVTPFVSWSRILGNPVGNGGTDYSAFPREAYFMDLNNITKRDSSSFLEVPVTLCKAELLNKTASEGSNRNVVWLRPNGRNLSDMLSLLDYAIEKKFEYVEFMIHSSELMPRGSPHFMSEESVERLYADMELLLDYKKEFFLGLTLSDFYLYKISIKKNKNKCWRL